MHATKVNVAVMVQVGIPSPLLISLFLILTRLAPCSNWCGVSPCNLNYSHLRVSYYASKSCTYTDSSGRPVPAPRPFNPECSDSQPSSDIHPRSYVAICAEANRYNPPLHPTNSSSNNQTPVTTLCQDGSGSNRKRIKNERGDPIPTEDTPADGPISGPSMDRPVPVKLDHSLTRELTNRTLSPPVQGLR